MELDSIIKLQFLPKLLPFSKFSTNSSSNCLLIRFVVFELLKLRKFTAGCKDLWVRPEKGNRVELVGGPRTVDL